MLEYDGQINGKMKKKIKGKLYAIAFRIFSFI